jgi:hypothetical protein
MVLIALPALVLPTTSGGFGNKIGLWQDETWAPDDMYHRPAMAPLPFEISLGLLDGSSQAVSDPGFDVRECSVSEQSAYIRSICVALILAIASVAVKYNIFESIWNTNSMVAIRSVFGILAWKFATGALGLAFCLATCDIRVSEFQWGANETWKAVYLGLLILDVLFIIRPRPMKGKGKPLAFLSRAGAMVVLHFVFIAVFVANFDFDGKGTWLHERLVPLRANEGSRLVPPPRLQAHIYQPSEITDQMRCIAGCESAAKKLFLTQESSFAFRPVYISISHCSIEFRNTTESGAKAEEFRYELHGAQERSGFNVISDIIVKDNLDDFEGKGTHIDQVPDKPIHISIVNKPLAGSLSQYAVGQCKLYIEVPSHVHNRPFKLPNITIDSSSSTVALLNDAEADTITSSIPLDFSGNTLIVKGSFRQVSFDSLRLAQVKMELEFGDVALKRLEFVNSTAHHVGMEEMWARQTENGTVMPGVAAENTRCVFPWTRRVDDALLIQKYGPIQASPALYLEGVPSSKAYVLHSGLGAENSMEWCSTDGNYSGASTAWSYSGPATFDSPALSEITTGRGDVWVKLAQSTELEINVYDAVYCLKGYNITMRDIICDGEAVATNTNTNSSAAGVGQNATTLSTLNASNISTNGSNSTPAAASKPAISDSLQVCKRAIMCSKNDDGSKVRLKPVTRTVGNTSVTEYEQSVVQRFQGLRITAKKGGVYATVLEDKSGGASKAACTACTMCRHETCEVSSSQNATPCVTNKSTCSVAVTTHGQNQSSSTSSFAATGNVSNNATTAGCQGGSCSLTSNCPPSEGLFLTCEDGSRCNPFPSASDGLLPHEAGWSCCSAHGGRAKCPMRNGEAYQMCAKPRSCAGGGDHCCMGPEDGALGCTQEGGPKNCSGSLLIRGLPFIQADKVARRCQH